MAIYEKNNGQDLDYNLACELNFNFLKQDWTAFKICVNLFNSHGAAFLSLCKWSFFLLKKLLSLYKVPLVHTGKRNNLKFKCSQQEVGIHM